MPESCLNHGRLSGNIGIRAEASASREVLSTVPAALEVEKSIILLRQCSLLLQIVWISMEISIRTVASPREHCKLQKTMQSSFRQMIHAAVTEAC